jgi:cytochrome c oxidase subunit 2
MIDRRRTLRLLGGAAVAAFAVAAVRQVTAASIPEVRISARKFEFTPHEVKLRRGEPVALVLTSQDRIHGFKCTALGLRTDIVPGQPTILEITPMRAGRFTFYCDVFCGDGHEDMEGTFIVEG